MNHVIKIEVDLKESKLPILISHLKKVADEHQQLVMKAIICKEEWKFTHWYQSLQVDERVWFSTMTKEARLNHVRKVQSSKYEVSSNYVSLQFGSSSKCSSSEDGRSSTTKLTVSCDMLKDVDISLTTLQGIRKKSDSLLSNNHVMQVSWSDNGKDRLVKSSSSDIPHLVKVKKNNCTYFYHKCPMYAGFSICSHVVASAEDNGNLLHYLTDFLSNHNVPNLTAIATRGLPVGAGRKGGIE